jgi:PAS domain-containing protein
MSIYEKRQEIIDFAKERIQEIYDYDQDKVTLDNIYDLHHEIFNTDYYIIGRYQAKQWMGADAFDCIYDIQEYENNNFGQVTTDLSEPERVVNMYVYIIGEEILEEVVTEFLEEREDELEAEESE